MRNNSIIGILIFMLMITAPLLTFADPVIDDSKNAQYLFTLASKSGTFEKDILTLKGVPLVVYFSDRPVRKSGHISLEEFIQMWDQGVDSFRDNPPNAELALFDKKRDEHAVVVLRNPKVAGNTISFEVEVIGETVPEKFEHSTLFIDVGIGMSGAGTL